MAAIGNSCNSRFGRFFSRFGRENSRFIDLREFVRKWLDTDPFLWRIGPLLAGTKKFPVNFASNGKSTAPPAEFDISAGIDARLEQTGDDR
jgi:hypothetical protein